MSSSHPLAIAAAKRREDTRARAVNAVSDLIRRDEVLTVARVCREARVSRSWLYRQPDILEAILQHRPHRPHRPNAVPVPPSQRASDPSLLRRLSLAQARIKELTGEVRALRDELAVVHGLLRHQRIVGTSLVTEPAAPPPQ